MYSFLGVALIVIAAVCVTAFGFTLIATAIKKTFEPEQVKPIKCPSCGNEQFYQGPEGVGGGNILCAKCGKEWQHTIVGFGEEIHRDSDSKLRLYGSKACDPFIDEWKAREELAKWSAPFEQTEELNYVSVNR